MADDSKKFRHPAGVAIRKGLDAKRYRRSDQGKAEKEARKAHNERFYSDVDRKTKRALKKAARDSDAAKGATMRKRGDYKYYEEFNQGGSVKKVDITKMSHKELDKYIKQLSKPLVVEPVKPIKKAEGGAVLSNRGGSFKGVR